MKKLLIFSLASVLFSAVTFAQDTAKWKTKQSGEMRYDKDQKGYISMTGNRMMMYKNGHGNELKSNMTLANGTVIMKDGTILTKSGKTVKLANGQWVDKDGELLYANGNAPVAEPLNPNPVPMPPVVRDNQPVLAAPTPEPVTPPVATENPIGTVPPVNAPTPVPPVNTPPKL